jgi:two-component system, OmpR family, sensor histidine kinase CreC
MKRLSLTVRLFCTGSLLVLLAGWFALYQVLDEIKPAVRQSTEETLVDTANLLAEMLADDLRQGTLTQGDLLNVLARYGQRDPNATIWGIAKDRVTHRIYVTDARGVVLLDSTGRDVGADYSRWNDVYRTLRGQYGARSTLEIPDDETSSVMYVAAPVRDGAGIIGVVTVAKPNRSVQPFIERARQRLAWLAGMFIVGGLIAGGVISGWLGHSIRRLTRYADAVTAGARPVVPQLPGQELNQLAAALDTMRVRLEGKAYVERYVQTLTHELKSPLAAIHGAAELLRHDMPAAQREKFLTHIDVETARLQALGERLLHLAHVEQRRDLEERVPIALRSVIDELLVGLAPRLVLGQLTATNEVPRQLVALGERFLVRQAIGNLLENAIDFTPATRSMWVSARSAVGPEGKGQVVVSVFNEGEPIPDYALARVTERFYSLPRLTTGRKSTGLGLNFVQEVAQLHGGSFHITNVAGGVRAELTLPA